MLQNIIVPDMAIVAKKSTKNNLNLRLNEENKMVQIKKIFLEYVIPFLVAQLISGSFIVGLVYLWTR